MSDKVRELIAKWRQSAEWMTPETPHGYQSGRIGQLKQCADELEAALAEPPHVGGASESVKVKVEHDHTLYECIENLSELWQETEGDSPAEKCMRNCGDTLETVLEMHQEAAGAASGAQLRGIAHEIAEEFCGGSETVEEIILAKLYGRQVCNHGPFVDDADEQQHKFHCETSSSDASNVLERLRKLGEKGGDSQLDELRAQFSLIDAATKWYEALRLFERTQGSEGDKELEKAQRKLAEACRIHNKTVADFSKRLRGIKVSVPNSSEETKQ